MLTSDWADWPSPTYGTDQLLTVVLDDDPSGTQTVHDVSVLTVWSVAELISQFETYEQVFFILTNTRSLSELGAYERTLTVVRNLNEASRQTSRRFRLMLRGDSTLRGHFPVEMRAVEAGMGYTFNRWVFLPFLDHAGHLTMDDIHYVQAADTDQLTPIAETPFAHDPDFPYRSSNLKDWVAEKTHYSLSAQSVGSISLDDIRTGGPDRVCEKLQKNYPVCIGNATYFSDVKVVAEGCRRAEAVGLRLLYYTASSFVQAYLTIPAQPVLAHKQMIKSGDTGGLVVVGSHVPKTTAQLSHLLELPNVRPVEVDVATLLDDAFQAREIRSAVFAVNSRLREGKTVVLYTSRELITDPDAERSRQIEQLVSSALVTIVSRLTVTPAFLIAKGGITSSDIATDALQIRRATVVGQALPGVPVWRMGAESRFPNMPYIIFPGSVGEDNALAKLTSGLMQAAGAMR